MGYKMTPDPDLVSAYWTHWRLSASQDRNTRAEAHRDWWWAWEAVEEAVAASDEALVDLLVALADAVPGDEAALAYLGAGPIETLLVHQDRDLAPQVLDALDAAARRNPNFRLAVRCVWWGDECDPALVKRFQRFGPPV